MKKIVCSLLSTLSVVALTQGCTMWSSPHQDIQSLLSKADAGWLKMSDYERGKHYIAVGDYGLAIEAFNNALAADPKSVPAMNGLAIAYDRINREDIARTFFEKALAIDAHSANTLNNIAYLDLSHGNKEEALAYFARAKEALASGSTSQSSEQLATVVENNFAVASVKPQISAASVPAVAPEAPQLAALESISPKLWDLHLDRADEKMRPLQSSSIPFAVTEGPSRDPGGMTAAVISPKSDSVYAGRKVAIRIANGTGRYNMAHRFQRYLANKGVAVDHLVNERGERRQSTIYYSRGLEKAAEALAKLLPVPVRTVGLSNNDGAVELILAPDLAGFDQKLGMATRT